MPPAKEKERQELGSPTSVQCKVVNELQSEIDMLMLARKQLMNAMKRRDSIMFVSKHGMSNDVFRRFKTWQTAQTFSRIRSKTSAATTRMC